jgi:hypothetical protein
LDRYNSKPVKGVVITWGDYIASETLTTRLQDAPPLENVYVQMHALEGENLILALKQFIK